MRLTAGIWLAGTWLTAASLPAATTGVRDLPASYAPGKTLGVTVVISPDSLNPPASIIMRETPPPGWTIVSSAPAYAKFSPADNTYTWLWINRNGITAPIMVNYTVLVPGNASGTATFGGQILTSQGTVATGGDTSIGSQPVLKGDLDRNGIVDVTDVLLCLRMTTGLIPEDIPAADMDRNGTVDISDVLLILRKSLGSL